MCIISSFEESIDGYGASIPPGSSAQTGALYTDADHMNMAIFDQQIRAFRAWMRDRGQQNKPLIVSEYGVLYSHIAEADTAQEVQDFMIKTFDYFLNTQIAVWATPPTSAGWCSAGTGIASMTMGRATDSTSSPTCSIP